MSEVRPTSNDEIDLVGIIIELWDGKWKIIGVALISLLTTFVLTSNQSSFKAITKIMPLTTMNIEVYQESNNFFKSKECLPKSKIMPLTNMNIEVYQESDNFFRSKGCLPKFFVVTPSSLLSLYAEHLSEKKVFEEAIVKYKLLDVANYASEIDFNEAVSIFASAIKVLPSYKKVGSGDDERTVTSDVMIEAVYNDKYKWKQLLLYVTSTTNQNVKEFLQKKFNNAVTNAKRKNDFELEGLALKIDNALIDYNIESTNKLAFLNEQAAIARKLGVAKNTIESQTFSATIGMLTNVDIESPFYLRGYEAIEKEIALIESRKEIEPFIEGLLLLQSEYRVLKQEQDMNINRAESLFAMTPILNNNSEATEEFSAISFDFIETNFEAQNKRTLILAIAALIGAIIGSIYVLISNTILNRKDKSVKV